METPAEVERPQVERTEETTAKKSSYTNCHKTYYEKNKEAILAKRKETKPHKVFYEKNKERMRKEALERYYRRKERKAQEAAQVIQQ
jgi:hypothetical protein